MFGLRTSPGSTNEIWPKRHAIMESVNKLHKKDRARPRQVDPHNVPKLTVGGRALAKHGNRDPSFWGSPDGKTEAQKSELAYALANQIINESIWFNIHVLSTEETIVECRVTKGYGVRWKLDGTFLGFLESFRPPSE